MGGSDKQIRQLQLGLAGLYGGLGLVTSLFPRFFSTFIAGSTLTGSGERQVTAAWQGLGMQAVTVAFLFGSARPLTSFQCRGFAALMLPFFAWDFYWVHNGTLNKLALGDAAANVLWLGGALYIGSLIDRR